MFRDILSSRAIRIGLMFFVLMVAGSLLYSRHVRRTTEAELEPINPSLQTLKNKKAKQKAAAIKTASPQVPTENITTAEKPVNEKIAQIGNNTEAEIQHTDTSPSPVEAKDVPTSPFGLGPYPEIPQDYIIPPDKFKWDFWGETLEDELTARVRIKLWKQGVRSDGASFENGKVYPTILGTIYVKWDGEIIRRIKGHPDDDFDAIEEALEAGLPPPEGITVLNFDDAGIDPYTFLELN